jgi:hypothetical protein
MPTWQGRSGRVERANFRRTLVRVKRAGQALGWLAIVVFVLGAGLIGWSCTSFDELASVPVRPTGGGWVSGTEPVMLPAGRPLRVELWVDYAGEGGLSAEGRLRSASGAWHPIGAGFDDQEGGSTYRRVEEMGSFVPADPGPWTVEVSLYPRGIDLSAADVSIRSGTFPFGPAGSLLLSLGILLGILAGALERRAG